MAAKKEKAAKIGAPRKEQEWRGEYDFAEDGGDVGSFPLRGGDPLPEGSVVYGGYADVEEPVASAVGKRSGVSGHFGIKLGGQALLSDQRGDPAWTVGRKSLAIGESALVLSGDASPQVTISEESFSAGKVQLVLFYFEPSESAQAAIKERKEQEAAAAKRAAEQAKAEAKAAAKAK